MKAILLAVILLTASNTDSCGAKSDTATENPDPQTSVQPAPAPSPIYSANQPAAEYESEKEEAK